MNYDLGQIEDQLLATIRAESSLKGIGNIRTHTGEISMQTFLDPAMMEGFVNQLPFIFMQYQGRALRERDNVAKTIVFRLSWRFYIGAKSLRTKDEAQKASYAMLASVYDAIHGKVPLTSPQKLSGWGEQTGFLTGVAITNADFNPMTGFIPADGLNERLIVNLPTIVVYQTDYYLEIPA